MNVGCEPNEPGSSIVAIRTLRSHLIMTFDDGPEPGGTDQVLNALAEAHATATFFVLLDRVIKFPNLFREVAESGHEIGLHGVDHTRLTSLPSRTLRSHLQRGRQDLEDILGTGVTWFRPAYGGQDPATWEAVVATGMVPVFFGPMCRDWLDLPPEDYLAEVRNQCRPGQIVLMHDAYAGTGQPPTHHRGELTQRVLGIAASHGLMGTSLGAALSAPGATPVFESRLDRNPTNFVPSSTVTAP